MKIITSGEELKRLIRQSVEKINRAMKRNKEVKALVRAEELAMTIDPGFEEWNNFLAWVQKVIDGEQIVFPPPSQTSTRTIVRITDVFPSPYEDSKPTIVRATRNGRNVCFSRSDFVLFATRCYTMGEASVYRNIKAAYMRGEVKTVEDVLEAEQEAARRAREPFDRTKKNRIPIFDKAAKLWKNTPGLSQTQAFREYFPENDENFETALRSFRNYIKRNKITQRRKVEFPKIGKSKVLELR